MLRRVGVSLILGALLASFGCQTVPTVGGKPLEKEYRAVVSLSPSTTEVLLGAAAFQGLKGRTSACNNPMSALRAPIVASVKPDYERLAEIKPDLVVLDAALYNAQDLEKIKGLGADIFQFDADTIDEFLVQLFELGSKLGRESSVSSYVDRIMQQRNNAEADPILPKPKVAILLPSSGGQHMVAGVNSFYADVVKASGGEPVGPDSTRFEMLNAEALVGFNPDVLVLALPTDEADAERAFAAVRNDPRLRSINAVKNGRYAPVNQDVVLRRGSRVDRFIENLHRLLRAKRDREVGAAR